MKTSVTGTEGQSTSAWRYLPANALASAADVVMPEESMRKPMRKVT